jgi:hypothetical protein
MQGSFLILSLGVSVFCHPSDDGSFRQPDAIVVREIRQGGDEQSQAGIGVVAMAGRSFAGRAVIADHVAEDGA